MSDCIIIGGGIIGMLTARNLHLAGCKVTLLEKSDTGKEATWAGGGIVSPLYPWRYADSVSHLASWGQANYESLCLALLENTGIDPEYTKNGLLILAPDEEKQALSWAEQFSPSLETVSADELEKIEPAMKNTGKTGIWMKDIAQVRNPRIAKALRAEMDRLGIIVMPDSEVVGFKTDNNRISGAQTRKGVFTADKYAVCTGAWTGEFLKPFGLDIPVHPVQGQMILFKAKPDEISRIVLETDRYVIPRRDGRVLFGSTVEHVDFDKQVTASAKKELHDIAVERFPVLKDRPIEHHWAGLRPGSPDGIPVISQHPAFENLYINAGHFRNGVVLAPGSCQLMSEIMLGHETSFDAHDYALTTLAKR